ncbi:hypothetical protein PybrP1_009362 [[Pythium] brassicae (nom. inval.)]|nr:hypothetical protein PybrP1_009362 [[Pythium] brassicae (nom. inval.)]
MNGDSVDIAVAKSREVAMDATWMYIYCASLVLSCGATLLATYHMRQLGGDMLRSTVRFVILCFLLCSALHALAGALFYTFLIAETRAAAAREEAAEQRAYDAITPAPAHANTSRLLAAMADGSADSADDTAVDSLLEPDHNADGGEAAFITKLTHAARPLSHVLTTFLMMENMFFLFSAYWIVLVTRELFTLAMATLDRGEASERAAIRRYVIGAGAILAAFLLAGLPIVITQKGYNRAYRFMGISELAAIVASMLFAAGSLGVLRSSGRKHEHVHGMLSRSPLYQRIKRMLVVCIVFTLPYCVLQIGLLAMSADQVDSVPDYVVGVATMLYYLFGAAQALVMGGSQQCCLRILAPIIPMHVRNSPEWANLRASRRHDSYFAGMAEATPPAQPVFVITDIEASSALWATAPPHVIDAAQQLHDDLMRASLPKFRGYEITTVGDSFQLAFHSVEDAASYALEVQLQLLHAKWPHELDGLVPATKTEWAIGLKPQAVFRGLRVRMGIHDTNMDAEGQQVSQVHPVTGKTLYIGASEFLAREVGDAGFGGQIVVSQRVAAWLRGDGETRVATPFRLDYLGAHPVEQLGLALELYELTPKVLDARRKAFRKRRGIEESRATDDDVACSAVGSALDAQAQDTESTTDESASGGDYKSQQTPTAGIRSGLATVWWRRG